MPHRSEKRSVVLRETTFLDAIHLSFELDTANKNKPSLRLRRISGSLRTTVTSDSDPNLRIQGSSDSDSVSFSLSENELGLTPAQLRNLMDSVETALVLKKTKQEEVLATNVVPSIIPVPNPLA